jgi:hypothetical protein
MNRVVIESSVGLDRIATWNEVPYALSFSSQCIIELAGPRNDSSKIDSDFSGRTGNLSEDDMWLAIVGEMPDSESN